MGNTWEVYAWRVAGIGEDYRYVLVYFGESRAMAMRAARKERSAGCAYIKIEWRGRDNVVK